MQHEVELLGGVDAGRARESVAQSAAESERDIVRDVRRRKRVSARTIVKVRESCNASLQVEQRVEAGSSRSTYERDVLRDVGTRLTGDRAIGRRQPIAPVCEIRGREPG